MRPFFLLTMLGALALAQPAARPPAAWLDTDRSEPAGTHYRTFPSQLAGGDVSYLIYLPPDYDSSPGKRYPVVYWLHGYGGSQRGGAPFVSALDANIRSGHAPATIAVLVNGMRDSFYCDSRDGKWPIESVITRELIPHIDATYRTIAKREARAVEGYSMGGFGAAHLGFKYPQLFGQVGIMAGALIEYDDEVARHDPIGIIQKMYSNDKPYFEKNHPSTLVRQNADAIRRDTVVRVAIGADDSLLPRDLAMHELLTRLQIRHEYEVVPGVAHNAGRFYTALGGRAFAWYRGAPAADRLAWWRHDRYGMFMHWGLYSIPAGEWKGQPVPGIAEWVMRLMKVPVGEYAQLAGQFNPTHFDAEEWVRLAKAAGQRYIVITTKHHDGFAMWHSKASKFNVYDATPFHRDVIGELAAACHRNGLRIGFYYSQTQDWHEKDGVGNDWDYDPKSVNFDRYLQEKVVPQVRELLTEYGPAAFLWFDTPRNITAAQSKMLADLVHTLQPDCLVNARVGNDLGDFKGMDDNEIPVKVADNDWETVTSLNDSWGFKKSDTNWKSARIIIRQLADVVSKNGFYSVNIGPDADGVIPPASAAILRQVGDWLRVNGAAIYGVQHSPFPREFAWGSVTAAPGKLYLHISEWPSGGNFTLYGLLNRVGKASILTAGGAPVGFSQKEVEGRHELHLQLPATAPDPNLSVIALDLDGAARVDPALTQQPDGKVTLSCAFAQAEGPHLNIGSRGIALNWLNPASSLRWDFKLYRPGAYEVVALTSEKWTAVDWSQRQWSGDHSVRVSVAGHDLDATIERQGEVIDPRSPNFRDVRTVIGKVNFASAGEQSLSVRALKINAERKLGFRLREIQLVPVGARPRSD